MNRILVGVTALLLAGSAAWAQTVVQRRPFVRASGDGVVSVRPDQAKISVAVQNQAATADQAASDNATRTQAVFDALRKLLGADADLKTLNYSLSPGYNYPPNGGTPILTGYTATNSIQATTSNLALIGRIIDTAVQAGATNIGGIVLGLKDEDPARAQALKLAGQNARAKAEAIATGLNGKLGQVLSAEEASAVRPIPLAVGAMAAEARVTTPVEPGTLEIHGSVTVEFELL